MTETTVSDIDVNGVTLRVHQAGDPANPTVVLSHGFPELAYSWRHQMAPLAEAGFHVIAPDQRGYGHSSAPTRDRRLRHRATSPATCWPARPLRQGRRRVRRPRLGRADRVGSGPPAPGAGARRRRRQRAVRAVAGPADPADEDDVRRPLLLHPLLPAAWRRRRRARRRSRTTRWPRCCGVPAARVRSRDTPAEMPPMEGTGS